jgi:hypothetical protein
VNVVELFIPPIVAVMVDVPMATPVTTPCVPEALETLATAVSDDLQVTWLVRSCVELSEYMPMAMNCTVPPAATLELAGVTMIISRIAGVTVSTVVPVTPSSVARIVDVPLATPVATPGDVEALEIVDTDVSDDAQVT